MQQRQSTHRATKGTRPRLRRPPAVDVTTDADGSVHGQPAPVFRQLDAQAPPVAVERETMTALQRTIGNFAVGQRVLRRTDRQQTEPAGTSGSSGRTAAVIQRDPPPTTDPSQETQPKPADLGGTAKDLVMKYADKYINQLGDEAKKRLAEAWEESPGGVIAAGAIIGGAGVTYLIGTKSALPGLPDIPLDFLGGPFKGATMKLEMKGPVTSPESFSFKLTFKEQANQRKKQAAKNAPPSIYAHANPEVIAKEVDGPAFEVKGADADTNLHGANLSNLVRVIGNGMLAGAINKDFKPYVDLGELPPTAPEFAEGLKRIVDALIAAAPGVLGKIEQVNFRVFRSGQLRFIPIRPSAPPQPAAEPAP